MRTILDWAIQYVTRHYEALDAPNAAPVSHEKAVPVRLHPAVAGSRR